MANNIATPPETAELVKLLKTTPAAARLGISRRTLQDLCERKKIAFVKFGRNIRFHVDDLDAFIDSNRTPAAGWKAPAKGIKAEVAR